MAMGIMVKVMTRGPTGMLDSPVIFITRMMPTNRATSLRYRVLNVFFFIFNFLLACVLPYGRYTA